MLLLAWLATAPLSLVPEARADVADTDTDTDADTDTDTDDTDEDDDDEEDDGCNTAASPINPTTGASLALGVALAAVLRRRARP